MISDVNVTPADGLSPVNHVFVDFENVHAIDPKVIGSKAVTVKLLLGPKQTKLDVTLVERLLAHAASVELVRITAPGKNALDFALAYYVGRAAITDPAGYFHIISKDTGFDPLIQHLRSKNIRARRHDNFESLTFGTQGKVAATAAATLLPKPKAAAKPKRVPDERVTLMGAKVLAWPEASSSSAVPNERVALVLEHLRKNADNRPKRKTTLTKHVLTFFGNKIPEVEAIDIVEALQRSGHLAITEKGLTKYSLERN